VTQAAALRAAKGQDDRRIADTLRETVQPSASTGWWRLAVVLAFQQDYGGAIESASEGLEAADTGLRPAFLACLGVLLHVTGKTAQSQARFAEAKQAWPAAWRRGNHLKRTSHGTALCELGKAGYRPSNARRDPAPSRMFLTLGPGTFCGALSRP
jgi:hypothetical protein